MGKLPTAAGDVASLKLLQLLIKHTHTSVPEWCKHDLTNFNVCIIIINSGCHSMHGAVIPQTFLEWLGFN